MGKGRRRREGTGAEGGPAVPADAAAAAPKPWLPGASSGLVKSSQIAVQWVCCGGSHRVSLSPISHSPSEFLGCTHRLPPRGPVCLRVAALCSRKLPVVCMGPRLSTRPPELTTMSDQPADGPWVPSLVFVTLATAGPRGLPCFRGPSPPRAGAGSAAGPPEPGGKQSGGRHPAAATRAREVCSLCAGRCADFCTHATSLGPPPHPAVSQRWGSLSCKWGEGGPDRARNLYQVMVISGELVMNPPLTESGAAVLSPGQSHPPGTRDNVWRRSGVSH